MEVKVSIIPAKKWFSKTYFRIEEDVTMQGVTVKKGFISDGATIPRWFTALGIFILLLASVANSFWLTLLGCFIAMIPVVFPRINNYFAAVIVHDYHIEKKLGKRSESDKILKRCLQELGVQPWRYWPMYIAVRAWAIMRALLLLFRIKL
jgi:hypothetical protein